ncbi:hypothetical protein DDI_1620 [Dickeya dianthicola RNS04.9]|nr:hypothetical protein DDI_1620 [Dickeya dianthicola RNS04.9]
MVKMCVTSKICHFIYAECLHTYSEKRRIFETFQRDFAETLLKDSANYFS